MRPKRYLGPGSRRSRLSAFLRRLGRSVETVSPGTAARFEAALIGSASIAAVGAYVFQPVQRFAYYPHLFMGGTFLVFGLLLALAWRGKGISRLKMLGAGAMIVFGAFFLFLVATDALNRSEWNDRRCRRILTSMLKPKPDTRTDLPDLYTALGCRPLGFGPVDPNYRRNLWSGRPDAQAEQAHERFMENALDAELSVTTPSSDVIR